MTFVGGKGGVGKTTVAAALAVALADKGERCVVVSVDPAHSLGDALDVAQGAEPAPLPGVPNLSVLEVDPELERRRFLTSHRGALLTLLERGTYLDSSDAAGLIDLTIPGLDELAALFRLQSLLSTGSRLIVDTAPTGHTLRLLELPELARGWLGALQAMEARSRAVSSALVGAYLPDDASALLERLDRDLADLSDLLRDPERTRFVLVTGRQPVVLAETLRYQEELARRGIAIGGVVVNRSAAPESRVREGEADRRTFVPLLRPEPVGLAGLRRFAAHLAGQGLDGDADMPAAAPERRLRADFTPPLDRTLYLVGGKGGVGKSTTAAALALRLREAGRRVLLLSVDPAGSLSEVLSAPVGTRAEEVPDAPGLWARQLDAPSAWEEFREDYQAEAERLFSGLLGSSGVGSDRAVVERLVDLAPPGIDELAALVEVVDAMEDRPYDALVLDTAPTGHFIRLLELPEVALEWTHHFMRLLLKYREVLAPGELAERLLKLARSLRAFGELLRDPVRSWLLVVALPEALSVPETDRLVHRLRELGLEAGAVLVNRLLTPEGGGLREGAAEAVGALGRGGLRLVAAPDLADEPRGVEALSAFSRRWQLLEL